jgi:hypothetical protein
LIEFLRRNHPESLPKVRNVDVSDASSPVEDSPWRARTGKEHERGDTSPGVHTEGKTDGAASDH